MVINGHIGQVAPPGSTWPPSGRSKTTGGEEAIEMSKRGLFGAAAALVSVGTLAAVTSAAAQTGDERRPAWRAGRADAALAESLGLSDQQKAEWRALHEKQREEMKPVMEEGRALRKRLREAVEAASPDATAVGEATLALEAHRKKVRAEREAFRQKLEGVLDPAQKEKLKAFEAGRRTGMGRAGRRGPRLDRRQPQVPVEG
jgi:Spy/CpxP family protein refolding chaperone